MNTSDESTQKTAGAAAAAAAGRVAEYAINTHGLNSPEARSAVETAYSLTLHAARAGCTPNDYAIPLG